MPSALPGKTSEPRSIPLQRVDGEERLAVKDQTVYEIVTERIIALLEQGTVPWQKPWANTGEDSMPRNLVSGKPYRGVNVFLLHAMSYGTPFFLTYKQAQALGGTIRKGEKACPVVFWKWLENEAAPTADKKRIPLLRYYSVFNVAQCEGIEAPQIDTKGREHSPIESAERIVAGMPKRPEIHHGRNRAAYSPALDCIYMPQPETFRSGEDYYAVVLHELVHSSGHETRLNRKGIAGSEGEWSAFGSASYGREELIAELGSAFLCGHAGIVERTVDNSAAYLAGWLQQLREDSRHQIIF
jgi:antirestriction protein ArdC